MSWEDDELEDGYDYEDDGYDEEDDDFSGEIEIELPTPHAGQQLVIDSPARFKVLLCGRRWGKTLVSQIIAINAMLDGKQVAYVTPEFGLGKDFFKDLLAYLPRQVIRVNNKSDLYIELITGGSLKFFSGEAIDSFRGRKFHLVILDEASKLSDLQNAWGSAIRPTLTDYRGEAIFISTPRGRDFFYQLYLRGLRKEAGFESWHFTTYDNPTLPAGEVDEMAETLNSEQFKEEILAEPLANVANPFGEENIRANTITELSTQPPVVYGVDLANSTDFTVVVGLDAFGQMCHFERFQKLGWEETFNRIKKLDENVTKVIDNTGVGSVICDRLIQSGAQNVIRFTFNAANKPPLIQKLIMDIENGNIKVNEVTAHELLSLERKYTSNGHIKFQAQSGAHDDCVMALALANNYFINTKSISNWQLYTA